MCTGLCLRKETALLVFRKDLIYGIGIAAGCVLVLAAVVTEVYIFTMMMVGVVLAAREERARNRTR